MRSELPLQDLSRLMSGDLPSDEAEALLARIEVEPELARAWEAMQTLGSELATLPEEAPPAHLDARVLGRATPSRRAPGWLLPGAAVLAAVALVAVGLGEVQPTTVVVEQGTQLVQGRAEVLAAGIPVSVDGSVRISVEPDGGLARVSPSEGSMMKTVGAGVAGAALGALVTVVVTDGHASVGGDEPIELGPGERKVVRIGGPTTERPAIAPVALPEGASDAEKVAALRAENEALRAELEELRFSEGVARGQLAASQGDPSEWPDDVPAGFAPEAFEANLRAAIAQFPGVEVHALDCGEYPCVAALTVDGSLQEWQDKLRELPKAMPQDLYGDAGVWMGMAQMDHDGVSQGAIGLSFMPQGEQGEPIRQRTNFRGQTLMQELETE
ncbi:MAG: hypothetical protein H6738_00285 [Alphaproteobacteria bacterium]|nr:hypothetical protein [Alphaproteobacteria bacterium]MCB9695204.1 hypothetical protein [Alphaproteobacteria bacterium]